MVSVEVIIIYGYFKTETVYRLITLFSSAQASDKFHFLFIISFEAFAHIISI